MDPIFGHSLNIFYFDSSQVIYWFFETFGLAFFFSAFILFLRWIIFTWFERGRLG